MDLILRVAARAVTQEQLTTWMVKLRKKSHSSLSVKQVVAVLEYLGGWKVEPVIGLEAERYANGPSQFADRNPEFVQQRWESAKADEVSTLPTNPVKGKRYLMDVGNVFQMYPSAMGFTFREWWGRDALRFTSPEGKTFDLIAGAGKDLYKLPPGYDLLPWAYKETRLIEQISQKLALPTPDEEKANRAPRTRENTGSCPCCFGNFKLRAKSGALPVVVLHGFKRPGWGQGAIGRCYGVDFPPFELSPEGTKHLKATLEKGLDFKKDLIRDLKSGKTTEVYIKDKRVTRDSVSSDEWDRLVTKQIARIEDDIDANKRDISVLTKLIATWEEKPLPEPGKSMTVWKTAALRTVADLGDNEHYVELCRGCRTVMAQCRCKGARSTVYGLCSSCS